MIGKVNINKTNDLESLRAGRTNDVKSSGVKKSDTADAKSEVAATGDTVRFSDRAGEVGKLVDRIKQLPDVRQEKVSELRGRIEAGEYNPSSEDIADAILNE